MKTTKKIIAWLHLWLGLVVGLLFSLAAITGSILVFEKELDPLLYHSFYYMDKPVSSSQKYLSIDHLANQARLYAQEKPVHSLLVPANPSSGQNVLFQTEGKRLERVLLAINPYTGQLEEKIPGNRHLFTLAEDLHRELLMGKTGKTITGICCLSYLTILLSGLILWWPKNQKVLRQRLKIKWDAKFKRLNWDLHAVGGFYTLPILFIIAFTGLTWSYKWFNDSIFYLFDGKGPQKPAKFYHFSESSSPQGGPLQMAYLQAQQLLPYAADVTITLPSKESNVVSVSKEQPQAAISNVVDRLLFSAQSGELIKKELYENQSKGMKVRRLVFPIHTGSIYGLPTKILVFLSCFIGASMPITGFIIWLKRKKKTKKTTTKPKISSEQPVLQ
jgi:uncharacterized iron-regulated membrane protein